MFATALSYLVPAFYLAAILKLENYQQRLLAVLPLFYFLIMAVFFANPNMGLSNRFQFDTQYARLALFDGFLIFLSVVSFCILIEKTGKAPSTVREQETPLVSSFVLRILEVFVLVCVIAEASLLEYSSLTGAYSQEAIRFGYFDYLNVLFCVSICARGRIGRFLLVLMLVHICLNLLSGHRLRAVTTILLIFFAVPRFSSTFKVLVPGIILLVLVTLVGFVRSGDEISLYSFIYGARQDTFSNHFAGVVYSSMAIMNAYESALHTVLPYILSPVFPKAFWPDYYLLAPSIERNIEDLPGGGLIFAYFSAWLGSLGIVVSALLYYLLVRANRTLCIHSPFIILASCYVLRTLAYEPVHLIKAPIYGLLLFALLKFSDRLFRREYNHE